MPTATAKKTPQPARQAEPTGSTDAQAVSLQRVIDDLEQLRELKGEDLRRQLDHVTSRVRETVEDLRDRTDERTAAIERTVFRVADDAWTQLATLAIHGLRDPEALDELTAEIRKCKAQLRANAKRAAAKTA